MYFVIGLAVAAAAVLMVQLHLIVRGKVLFPLVTLVGMTLLNAGIFYLNPPALTGPFWGMTMWLVLNALIAFLLAFGAHGISSSRYEGNGEENELPWGMVGIPIFLVLVIGRTIIGSGFVDPESFAGLIGEVKVVETASDFSPVDISHIRMVPLEQAMWAGDKAMGSDGTIGSQFKPGDYSLQRVDGKLFWIAPLDFLSYSRWQSTPGVPGYIMVDAEDAGAEAKLVVKHDGPDSVYRYTPGAYFGKNLTRHIWESGYRNFEVWDYHFELDDQHMPHWVVSLVQPTIGYSGEKVVQVLLVSPFNGEIEAFEPKDVPAWVDRIVPEDLAVRYIGWWGHYSQGWWPAWWSGLGIKEPTVVSGSDQEIAWLVWGKDGKAHWFTGMTSTSTTDNSLISVVTVDSRTGEAREYRVTGINEDAVISAVNASVSNFEGYHGTNPILYEISGEKVWVVPVLSNNHMFQKLAIVRASNGQVVLGDSKAGAVRELKNLLARDGNRGVPGEDASFKTLQVKILRISADVINGNSTYHVIGENLNHVLLLQSSLSPKVPVLKAGDIIEVGVLETTDEAISVQQFKVLQWNSQRSE